LRWACFSVILAPHTEDSLLDTLPPALAGLPASRPEEIGLSRAGLKRLIVAMEREIAAGKAPGAAMAIGRHGKVGFSHVLGARAPGGAPMSADTIFRIYSMTKPIVSVAAMTLVEEGRLLIGDPLAKYIPAFANMRVGVEVEGGLRLEPAKRPITIQDLMRHTSGLTYGFTGVSEVQRQVNAAGLGSRAGTSAEFVDRLAALPLMHQPGEVWEYSLSTDVLGRVLEIIDGASLGEVLRARVLAPLGMVDTAFFTSPAKLERRAEPFSFETMIAAGLSCVNDTAPPAFEFGGGGLVSTLSDYARFLSMLAGGGVLEGARILGPRTLAYMASDHLGPAVLKPQTPLLWPGHGFGLGFAVRLETGMAPTPGSIGEYFWGGVMGTSFWVSPRDSLFAVLMVQAAEHRDYFRNLFRNLVNAAIL